MSLSFRKWREMALTEYPVVSDKYYKKVYENSLNPQAGVSLQYSLHCREFWISARVLILRSRSESAL